MGRKKVKPYSPSGTDIVRECERVMRERLEYAGNPLDYVAVNVLYISPRTLRNWLEDDIEFMPIIAARRLQKFLSSEIVDGHIRHAFEK